MAMKSTSKSETKRVAIQKAVKSLPKLPKIPAKGLRVTKTILVKKAAPKKVAPKKVAPKKVVKKVTKK
jgi:hypothetical protein